MAVSLASQIEEIEMHARSLAPGAPPLKQSRSVKDLRIERAKAAIASLRRMQDNEASGE